MPALIFIIVCIAIWLLYKAFRAGFWWGMAMLLGAIGYICIIAGFATGFGFIILWPIAFIFFAWSSACINKWGEKFNAISTQDQERLNEGYKKLHRSWSK
jgi:hypothetical protein